MNKDITSNLKLLFLTADIIYQFHKMLSEQARIFHLLPATVPVCVSFGSITIKSREVISLLLIFYNTISVSHETVYNGVECGEKQRMCWHVYEHPDCLSSKCVPTVYINILPTRRTDGCRCCSWAKQCNAASVK